MILITTPFSEKYNSVFSKEILFENFYKYVFQIKKKYKIEYLDFSRDKSFFRDEYFTDLDHLSSQGSKVFLEKIKL